MTDLLVTFLLMALVSLLGAASAAAVAAQALLRYRAGVSNDAGGPCS